MNLDELRSGPVVIGYDGSPPAAQAIRETGALVGPRPALVVVVWEPEVAYDALAPTFEPAPIDFHTVLQLEQELYEGAQRLAEEGASLARESKLDAEGLAVADDLSVSGALVRVARERNAAALAVGAHGHRALRELLLGSTTREVIHNAPCPVIVVREHAAEHDEPESGGGKQAREDEGARGGQL
jgi:nucleotide-binding universal stress UspA family protein